MTAYVVIIICLLACSISSSAIGSFMQLCLTSLTCIGGSRYTPRSVRRGAGSTVNNGAVDVLGPCPEGFKEVWRTLICTLTVSHPYAGLKSRMGRPCMLKHVGSTRSARYTGTHLCPVNHGITKARNVSCEVIPQLDPTSLLCTKRRHAAWSIREDDARCKLYVDQCDPC